MPPVTLQISLSPLDVAHASLIVPHQLRYIAEQCDEILMVWDMDPGPRYQESTFRQRWDQGLNFIVMLNQALQHEFPQLQIRQLNANDPDAENAVRPYIAGSEAIPAKDFRGGPFLSYLYALAIARYDHVLHLDSDMIFIGQSTGWIQAAVQALNTDPDLFCISPPGGPQRHFKPARYSFFTTRHFLSDRRRWLEQVPLQSHQADPANAFNCPPHAELLENTLSVWLQQKGLFRLEFALPDSDFCSLHPPVPPQHDFITRLPDLLNALAQGWMPECQYGHYNLQAQTLEALICG